MIYAVPARLTHMTRMSDHIPPDDAETRRKPATLLAGSPLARAVHDAHPPVGLMLPLVVLAGCVIPPSLSVDNQDAGVNSPPAVLEVRTEQEALSEGGPFPFERGDTGTLNVQLLDADVLDTLYVRVFIDYTVENPAPARVACPPAATGAARRAVTCNLTGLCLVEDVNADRLLSVRVFDRPLDESGTPPHQAMEGDGGLTTAQFFRFQCTDPES